MELVTRTPRYSFRLLPTTLSLLPNITFYSCYSLAYLLLFLWSATQHSLMQSYIGGLLPGAEIQFSNNSFSSIPLACT
jgi:hypothetical protein